MRREDEGFAARDLELVYIAKRLKDAVALETLLTEAGFDYLIETDTYSGGIIFRRHRVGAFFYVEPGQADRAREFLRHRKYKAHVATGRHVESSTGSPNEEDAAGNAGKQ